VITEIHSKWIAKTNNSFFAEMAQCSRHYQKSFSTRGFHKHAKYIFFKTIAAQAHRML